MRAARVGISDLSRLAKRVFLAWATGTPMRRGFVPYDLKISILDGFEVARKTEMPVDAFLYLVGEEMGVRIARGTLYNWKRRRDAGGDEALSDHRHGHAPLDWSGDPFMQEMARLRALPERPSYAECHRRASATASAEGWTVHSAKSAERWLRGQAKEMIEA